MTLQDTSVTGCASMYNGLEPTKMCFRFARDEQKGHIGSSSYHWLRFTGDGRTS